MLEFEKFVRKPFYVTAVLVTDENMADVAEWCKGNVRTTVRGSDHEEKYIKVRVHNSLSDRQTKAFVGDRVLYATTGFKVYTPYAFEKSFERVGERIAQLTKPEADEAGFKPPVENHVDPVESVDDEIARLMAED